MARRNKLTSAIPDAFTTNGFPLAEFDRRPVDLSPLRAFVLDRTSEITLAQVFNSDLFRLNGYVVFRDSDVRGWRAIPKHDFCARAAAFNTVRPLRPKAVKISSMKEAIASAGESLQLITIIASGSRKKKVSVEGHYASGVWRSV
jgi:hypothetical protein